MKNGKEEVGSCITMRIDKTTYMIRICFKEDAKETMDDKVRKIIRKEIQQGESA